MAKASSALAVLLTGAALAAAPASAQDAATPETGNFNAERLRPAMDRNGIVDVESAAVGPHLSYDVALWGSYGLMPLVLVSTSVDNERTVEPIIAHRVGANIVGAISVFEWVEIGLDVPVVLFQARDTGALQSGVANKDLSAVGLGDLRLSPKVRILRQADQFVDLAVMPSVTAPTALPKGAYFGDAFFTVVPELLVGRSFGPVRVGANLAARLRGEEEWLNLKVGSELLTRIGVAYSMKDFGLPAEIGGSFSHVTSLSQPLDRFSSGFEVLGGLTYDLPLPIPGIQAFGDLGFSPNAVFGMPTARVLLGVRWSPRDAAPAEEAAPTPIDTDGDGLSDGGDACVTDKEDADGFQDGDGCPDLDNDGDGILDSMDGCKDEAEDVDGDRDGDGCKEEPEAPPEPAPPVKTVAVTSTHVEITDKVFFELNKDVIQPASFDVLKQVAQALKDHPDIAKVSVEGHADHEGDDAHNVELSKRRAESVRKFLIGQGIPPERLVSVGHGDKKPIADNTTKEGREKNRRVEFLIVPAS